MSSEHPRWYRRRLVIALGALVVVLGSAAAVFALTRPGDVFNEDVEFRAEPTQTSVPTPEAAEPRAGKKRKKKKADPLAGFRWPAYGYSDDRRRFIQTEPSVRPPFKREWSWNARVLLEFPPIIVGNRLFLVDNSGLVSALDRTTGKRVWKRDLGHLAASSPAYGDGNIYVTILERSRSEKAGRVAALRARDGKVVWQRPLRSRTESSPLYVDGRIYFGAEDGTVYSMRTRGGSVEWSFRASGAVKGAPALSNGRLYFGAYGGNVYAVSRRTGRQIWRAGTSGATFGLSAGNFYSSPAVAFGRVYIGNTDGNMYSFSAESGRLAWRRATGSYVYASPAVAQVRGDKPTVYFGSYDGTFYALDARSGATRWRYRDGGTISGAATVVGDIVYYSNWGNRDSHGLWARSGKRAWHSYRGSFNAVVSDGETIYLTGYSTVAAYVPKSRAQERAAAERKAKRAAAAKKRKAARRKARAERGGKRSERRRDRAERRERARKRRRAARSGD